MNESSKRNTAAFGLLTALLLVLGISILLFGCLLFLSLRQDNSSHFENRFFQQDTLVQKWKNFSSADGRFSILFPGVPEMTNMFIDVDDQIATNVPNHIFYVNFNIQNSFAVAYEDSPLFVAPAITNDPQEFLKKTQSLMVQAPGRILFERETNFDGYPSREFEYAAGGKANYSVRDKIILVKERVYSVYVIFLTAKPYPADDAVFINSFSLIGRSAPDAGK
jgi:hypothetical protein